MLDLITSVRNVVVVTGAGFSAPSGLPVYRNGGANWLDAESERMSQASCYGNHLTQLWKQWHALAHAAKTAEPNAAHLALVRWERLLDFGDESGSGSMTIVTQNVDDLHQRAGSRDVIEVHGSIHRARLLNKQETFGYEPAPDNPVPPAAPNGSHRTRPDIVLFGERPHGMKRAMNAVQQADLVLFAGTSGRVWPVTGLLDVAVEHGALTMLINHEPWVDGSALSRFDITVIDDVTALDALIPGKVRG